MVEVFLPRHDDKRGHLVSIESGVLPFEVQRVFWIYGVPGGMKRGQHLTSCEQAYVAIHGKLDVVIDGVTSTISRPDQAVVSKRGQFVRLEGFSPGAVCLVLCSEKYASTSVSHP